MSKKPLDRKRPERGKQPASKSSETVIANWTIVVGLSTVLLFFATGMSAYFLYVTDKTLKETLEINQRPWLSVEVEAIGSFKLNRRGEIPLRVKVKNNGLSPAQKVRIFPVLFVDKVPDLSEAEVTKWGGCHQPKNDAYFGPHGALFPGQSLEKTVIPTFDDKDMKQIREPEDGGRPGFTPTVIVCVSYVPLIGEASWRRTSDWFVLMQRREAGGSRVTTIDRTTNEVDPERLFMMPVYSYAN
jgi:hypothetical protein